ncbi:hypothetical protein [Acetivibrio sp. MSJd-27]|uniref:hypothetical protein n=1 Tax=Acetivibrio sp. MSJd-27 TaxID=2841523 RepID=UPI001C10AB24|nr:hypothetical protein [Acetivibrio sp. MSJd-27]MBU5449187.1 hypothetical protein [Acetivibrio sp. MSJd-27]
MVFICLALCLLNTALCLYLLKERRKNLPMTEEDERNEAERRGKEEKLNEVFDYDPYGKQ